MVDQARGHRERGRRWTIGLLGALVPVLALGCGSNRTAGRPTQQQPERVAGERESVGDEMGNILKQGGLPRSFQFGGRTWTASQVHWIQGGATGVGGNPGSESVRGPVGEQGPEGAQVGQSTGNFRPVANLQVNGLQVFHGADMDESVSDNLYLRMGIPGESSTPTGPAATQPSTGRTAIIEYDASGDALQGMELAQLLQTGGMPQTVQHAGKTWTAQEVQLYDADVFANMKALPQPINGLTALQGKERNVLLVQGQLPGDPMTTGEGMKPAGVVFVRYMSQ